MWRRMMAVARAFAALMLLCMLATAAHAMGEACTTIYGGSGLDRLTEIAAGPDGRIVMTGSSESAGGLFMRKLEAVLTDDAKYAADGESVRFGAADAGEPDSGAAVSNGWTLCVDAHGNVLWSVCTQSLPSAPVLHEDGSLTVVMRRQDDDDEGLTIVRFDEDGHVAGERAVFAPEGLQLRVTFKWAAPEGYWFEAYPKGELNSGGEASYFLVRWDGETVSADALTGTYRGLAAYTARHIIRIDEPGGDEGGLYALDEAGNQTRLANAIIANRSNCDGLITLEDGGAAACGWVQTNGGYEGRLTRWDEQGNVAFDWWMDDPLCELARTQSGFVATAAVFEGTGAVDRTETGREIAWKLIFFDEKGIRTGERQLGTVVQLGMSGWPFARGVRMAQRSDGSIALLANRLDAQGLEDAWLTIIPKEEWP